MKQRTIGALLAFLVLAVPVGTRAQSAPPEGGFVYLSSTIGPIDAGIVGALEDAFEKDSGIHVRHVGAGTGAALELAKQGSVDLVLVHARSLEEKFVREGFGTERIAVMCNDFVIVGPAADPAGIKGRKTAAEALRTLAAKEAPFVSRGDKSGTHVAELELWEKAGVKPSGAWYTVWEKGSTGNAPTLLYTDEKGAYTVIDRATYLTVKDKVKVVVLVEKDEALLNFISVIPVNPAKFPRVDNASALAFARWLTAPDKGQKLIRDFGVDKYGSPLFFPNSDEWKKAQGR